MMKGAEAHRPLGEGSFGEQRGQDGKPPSLEQEGDLEPSGQVPVYRWEN